MKNHSKLEPKKYLDNASDKITKTDRKTDTDIKDKGITDGGIRDKGNKQ